MSKEDIIEGLKAAVGKGEPLNKAMISFYNSGYPKEDIEESAIGLTAPIFPIKSPMTQPTTGSVSSMPASKKPLGQPIRQLIKQFQPNSSQTISEPTKQKLETQKVNTKEPTSSEEAIYKEYSSEEDAVYKEFPSLQQPQTVQKVSQYGAKPSPVGTVIVFILVFFLLFLVGVLVSIFLFKDNITVFLNSFAN